MGADEFLRIGPENIPIGEPFQDSFLSGLPKLYAFLPCRSLEEGEVLELVVKTGGSEG
jgi:hypothetical protein